MITIWRTKDGTNLKLSEMTASHLHNCIAMLERCESQLWAAMPCASYDLPDGAYWAEQCEENAIYERIDIVHDWMKSLKAELDSRPSSPS